LGKGLNKKARTIDRPVDVKVEGLRVAQHLEVAAVDATLVDKLQIRISRNLEFLAIKIGFKLKNVKSLLLSFKN